MGDEIIKKSCLSIKSIGIEA